jgi:hypothetical protein
MLIWSVCDLTWHSEIFGPILPILAVDSMDEAIAYLKDRFVIMLCFECFVQFEHEETLLWCCTRLQIRNPQNKKVSRMTCASIDLTWFLVIAETVSGNIWFGDTFLPIAGEV